MTAENVFLTKKSLDDVLCSPFSMIGKGWYLLTAGTPENYNTMTASWGAMGEIWGTPSLHCFVRTNRYTLEFLERYEIFTASFFDAGYKPMLKFCGSNSGRDVDKVKVTGLDPIELEGGVTFRQARSVIVCHKMYIGDLQPEGFVQAETYDKWYADQPMHREIVGGVLGYYERLH